VPRFSLTGITSLPSIHLTVRKDVMNEPEEANRELRTYAIAATSTTTNLSSLGDVIKTVRRSFRSTHSALSMSSPIHEAIVAGNTNILNHLLALGYSPNIRPIAAPSHCLSPPDRHRILRSSKPRHPRSISQNPPFHPYSHLLHPRLPFLRSPSRPPSPSTPHI
jgi:hypothetical protein